jgi:hypothetical protein
MVQSKLHLTFNLILANVPATLQDEDVIRVPLVNNTFVRIFDSVVTDSSSGIVGIGIVGIMIVGKLTASSTKDQHYINCWPEKVDNPFLGTSRYFISKRPGFLTNHIPAVGNIGTAIHIWAGKSPGTDIISAFGSANSTVYNGTTSLGTVSGQIVSITDTLVGAVPNLLFTTSSNRGYYYPEGGALTQILDVDFPISITGQFVTLNGYNYIMTPLGQIWNSDLNSISNWTSTSFLSVNSKPDSGLGLLKHKNYIVGFGKESIEFFQNTDNLTGSPLIPVSQLTINIGAINQHSFKTLDDTIAWIGSSAQSRIGVYLLDGLNPKRVSSPTIDGILSAIPPETLYLNTIVLAGKTFIVIVSTSDSRTFVYCLEDGYWHEWAGTTTLWTHMAGLGATTKNIYAVSRATTSGKVYVITPVRFVFQDDGVSYTVTAQTIPVDGGSQRRKFGSKLWVIGDKYSTSNQLSISWSDDDYTTFSTVRTIELSSTDPYLSAIGSFRRRSFKITQTNSMPLRLETLEIPLKLGLH